MSLFRRLFRFVACLLLAAAVGACAYKVEVRQGREDVLNNIGDIRAGMSRAEVVAKLGDDYVRPFSPNTWIYVYEIREAGFFGKWRQLTAVLKFDDDGVLESVNLTRNDFDDGDAN